MKYQRYPAYRDTGGEWLGEIPSHWKIVKLKRVARLKSGEAIPADQIGENGSHPVLGGNGIRGYTNFGYTHEGYFPLIGRQGALCGNINYGSGKFWASEHAVVVSPISGLSVFWLGELLRSMNLNQYSMSAAQPGLSVEVISNLYIPLPATAEQRAIATFLDRETAKIDTLIAKQERLISLLQEKRQALISHVVTKGLNPDAPMKDSSVEWMGEVPAHWEVAAVAYRFDVQLGKMLDEKTITGNHLASYVKNADVQWDWVNISDLPEMDFSPGERVRYSLKPGDLLICEGGEVGRTAVWQGQLGECYYQKAIHRVRPRNSKKDVSRFMLYLMMTAAKLGVFVATGNPNTIDHLTAEKLRAHRFPFPPVDEQTAIVDFLDKQLTVIDGLVSQCRKLDVLLQERRTSLISAAVTGKIDVRGL